VTADVIAGRFALCDPIGSGGAGTVWRAFDRKEHRYCAAKLLRQRDAGDLLRFVREQSVRLDHPHIVSPYSWVAEDGTVLIASRLMTGGSLHTLIGDYGPLAESTVISVLRQVLSALQAVHDAELIHRDVKPANVLLRATGTGPLHVVLTDFGLTISRLDARLTQVGMVIGTPGYVPPEVLSGGVPPDPRHDLYAVGRLALTMIAGAEPTGRVPELIAAIEDPALRSTVPALLRHDPQERPADAAAAAVLLAGSPVDQTPRTRDGDPIEVLDQLPELPPGWGPDGPVDLELSRSARAAPRATIVDVAVTAPTPIPEHPPPPPVSGGSTRGRGRILAAAVAAATVVVGLVLAVWLLPGASTTNPTDPPTTVGTSAASTTPPASVGQATPIPPGTAMLRAGDGCTWQQEGDRRTDIDGAALVCTLADGSYQWRSPG
jgi:serine/threonine-protein kinase